MCARTCVCYMCEWRWAAQICWEKQDMPEVIGVSLWLTFPLLRIAAQRHGCSLMTFKSQFALSWDGVFSADVLAENQPETLQTCSVQAPNKAGCFHTHFSMGPIYFPQFKKRKRISLQEQIKSAVAIDLCNKSRVFQLDFVCFVSHLC